MLKYDQYINGSWIASSNGKTDEVLIPSNDEVVSFANDYVLVAMVYTNNMNKTMMLKQELEFGEKYINHSYGELHKGLHKGYKMSSGEDRKYRLEQY